MVLVFFGSVVFVVGSSLMLVIDKCFGVVEYNDGVKFMKEGKYVGV